MSVSEAQRLEMHRALQNLLGVDVSNTLMEHLPPSGWSDLVRMRDIIEMEKRLDARFERLNEQMNVRFKVLEEHMNTRFTVLEEQTNARFTLLDGRVDGLSSRVKNAIVVGMALGTALLAIVVQLLISFANL